MNPSRRSLLALATVSVASAALGGCASMLSFSADYDLWVDAAHKGLPGEKVGGRPTFKTIRAAVDSLPVYATRPRRIFICKGRYNEKLVVDKPFIALIGESLRKTVVSFDAYASQQKPDGSGAWGVAGSATLSVLASDFSAENLSIENAYDFLGNDAKDAKDPTRSKDAQAVALLIDKGAERSLLRQVNILGYQGTLFVNSGRSLFQQCRVAGNIDAIFGAGQALFEECEIVTRPRGKAGLDTVGFVTAPSTPISKPWGLVFSRCKLLRENENVPAKSTHLGHAWHPTASFTDGSYADPNAIGSAVFIDCFLDVHINEDGWAAMTGASKNPGERIVFQAEDARFFEYHNTGPGVTDSAKRRQLTDSQVANFSHDSLLGDWHP